MDATGSAGFAQAGQSVALRANASVCQTVKAESAARMAAVDSAGLASVSSHASMGYAHVNPIVSVMLAVQIAVGDPVANVALA